jgi:hypothetical protein
VTLVRPRRDGLLSLDVANGPAILCRRAAHAGPSGGHVPEPGQESEELAESPDLAPDFGFRERMPGACPAPRHVHCFNHAATLSHGKVSGDIAR